MTGLRCAVLSCFNIWERNGSISDVGFPQNVEIAVSIDRSRIAGTQRKGKVRRIVGGGQKMLTAFIVVICGHPFCDNVKI